MKKIFDATIVKRHNQEAYRHTTLLDKIEFNPQEFSDQILREDDSVQARLVNNALAGFNKNVFKTEVGKMFFQTFKSGLICALLGGAKANDQTNPSSLRADLGEYSIILGVVSNQRVDGFGTSGEYSQDMILIVEDKVLGQKLECYYGENDKGFYLDQIRHGATPIIMSMEEEPDFDCSKLVKVCDIEETISKTTICDYRGNLLKSTEQREVIVPEDASEIVSLVDGTHDNYKFVEYNSDLGKRNSLQLASEILSEDMYQINLNRQEVVQ